MISQLHEYVQTHHKTHLVFDFDKTIAQIDVDWTNWHTGVAAIYASYDPKHVFHPGRELLFLNDYVMRFGQEVSDEVGAFIQQYEMKHTRGFIPNDELITFIKANIHLNLSIYSSNSIDSLRAALAGFELENCFTTLVSKEDVVYIKPHPEGFNLIYDPKVPKSNYLMIGDSASDAGVARNFGVDFYKIDFFNR